MACRGFYFSVRVLLASSYDSRNVKPCGRVVQGAHDMANGGAISAQEASMDASYYAFTSQDTEHVLSPSWPRLTAHFPLQSM